MWHRYQGRSVSLSRKVNILSVRRERQEREEAEREGRPIQEDEPDDEYIQSPFQPIESMISEVSRVYTLGLIVYYSGLCCWDSKVRVLQRALYFHVFFRTRIKKRKGRGKESCRREGVTTPGQPLIKRKRKRRRRRRRRSRATWDKHQRTTLQVSFRTPGSPKLGNWVVRTNSVDSFSWGKVDWMKRL